MSRPMSLREYAELHEDPEHDKALKQIMSEVAELSRGKK